MAHITVLVIKFMFTVIIRFIGILVGTLARRWLVVREREHRLSTGGDKQEFKFSHPVKFSINSLN